MKNSEKNYQTFYANEKKALDKEFSKMFIKKTPISLYEPCTYIMDNGGKRLRPLLVLLSCKAAGGDYKKARNAALAVEILHNFTLVHDDIMDNADKRRGMPTLHKKYDISTAILAGDNLIAFAYQYLLLDCTENYKEVVATFTKGIVEVCEGQSLDKEFELKKEVSIKDYIEMIKKKTAALLQICCSIGAQIAGASKNEIKKLSDFGLNLGLAFQIQDDLLDIIGDEKEFGKTVGGDLIEGKKTYLVLKALEKAVGADKVLLDKFIENKGIKRIEVAKFKSLYIKLGIFDHAEKEIKKYTTKALDALKDIKDEGTVLLMNSLANSLITRTK